MGLRENRPSLTPEEAIARAGRALGGTLEHPVPHPLPPPEPEPEAYPWRVATEGWEGDPLEHLLRAPDPLAVAMVSDPRALDETQRKRLGFDLPLDMAIGRAVAQLQAVYRGLDGLARAMVNARSGKPICVEHCALCCEHGTPAATDVEAMVIAHWLYREAPPASVPQIEARLLAWAEAPMRVPPTQRASGLAPERATLSPEQQQVAASPCPFLNPQTKQCDIHPVRPLRCRGYSVTLAPDEFCERELTHGETPGRRYVLLPENAGVGHWAGVFRDWWVRCRAWGLTERRFLPWQVLRYFNPQAAAVSVSQDHSAQQAAKRVVIQYPAPVPAAAFAVARELHGERSRQGMLRSAEGIRVQQPQGEHER